LIGKYLRTSRAQSPPVSEANTLYEDTQQAKSAALLASFVKLCVPYIGFYEHFADYDSRSAPPKPLLLKPRNDKMEVGERLDTILI
jgi:hypothetical protein